MCYCYIENEDASSFSGVYQSPVIGERVKFPHMIKNIETFSLTRFQKPCLG